MTSTENTRKSLEERYQAALATFFNREEEKGLFEISMLGKELVVARMGPDVLLDIHSICLRRLLEKLDPVTVSKMVINANELLLSGIMAYAMNYYSFMDLLDRVQEELREKNIKLEEANERLQEVDRLKTMFIATMNHELRTPLNTIIGYSRNMLDRWAGPVTGEQEENLQIVLGAGRHLLSLINDIIDLSRIEAGRAEAAADAFDLQDVLREGIEALSREATEKGLSLEADFPSVPLLTDRRRLFQAVLNLISNAVKFTDEGFVRVSARPEGDDIVIDIIDTGVGIPAEKRDRLFTPFTRLAEEQVPGTGLGLYLTRKMTTEILHGGLTYNTGPGGRGSVFSLRIPRELPIESRNPDSSPSEGG